jgi:aldehyde:ferredoxin oxidoreductase
MGADHTAGLTYRIPRSKTKQAENSLKAQVQAAVCDAFGYCLNAVPGGRTSLYPFLADMLNARFGGRWTGEDVLEIGKQTLRDQLAFNEKAEFNRAETGEVDFMREEAIAPTNQVFDVAEGEIRQFWAIISSPGWQSSTPCSAGTCRRG